jgi:hypothetical protein
VAIGPDVVERLQVLARNSLELLETSVQVLEGHKRGRSSVIVKKYPTIVKITKQQFLTITEYFKPIN